MPNSSSSQNLSSQPSIKIRHRLAKKKTIRRRRIDLKCGCSYYLHISCQNHGFSHRGIHYCGSSMEWRVYLEDKQPPIFHDNRSPPTPLSFSPRHNTHANTIQPQPSEGVGDSQSFPELPNLDDFTASDWSFLKGI
uniref:Transcriptional activator protein n=1 Tax=Watermelon chlorotic stunt virus TaxID=35341 RepID=M9SWH4_9GEMI|nr:AC2 [Watermelon chlorotic stunt virus]AIF75205.1 AC2 [Watermelon chlorotic stunt virus]